HTKTGAAVSQQTDDYYPFGMEINNSVTSPKNEYLYNKKELQEEIQEYDYGARFYDPIIARFTSVDPLAEYMRRFSDYAYGFDNPLRFLEKDGMNPIDIVYLNEDGKEIKRIKDPTVNKTYVIKTSKTARDIYN